MKMDRHAVRAALCSLVLGGLCAAQAETWVDGARTWTYSQYASVALPGGSTLGGSSLVYSGQTWNSSRGVYDYTPCVMPRPAGALVAPKQFVSSVWTNGWNEYVGTNLVHHETVTTNWSALVKVDSHAFEGCSDLTELTLPGTVRMIGAGAFTGCSRLGRINGLQNVQVVEPGAFAGTPWWNGYTNGVEFVTLNGVLVAYNGTGPDVVVPNGVATIGQAFRGRSDIRTVTLPASTTTIAPYAFYGSGVSKVVMDKVATIGSYAFYECKGLTQVALPETLASMGTSAFQGCSGISSVSIPASLKTVPSYAFYGCGQLRTLTGGASVSSVESGAFDNTPLTDASAGTFRLGVLGSVLYGCAGTATGALVIPEGVTSVKPDLFRGNARITSLTLPASLRSLPSSREWISASSGGYFGYRGAFEGCTALKSVTIKGLYGIAQGMFRGCTALSSVSIPDCCGTIGDNAFEDCDALQAVNLPAGVSDLGEKAFAYSGLVKVTGGEGLLTVGEGAFEGTPFIDAQTGDFTSVGHVALEYWGDSDMVVPDGLTRASESLFVDNPGLTSISLPKGFVCGDRNYHGKDSFLRLLKRNCRELARLEFRNGAVIDGNMTKDGAVYNEAGTVFVWCPPRRAGSLAVRDGVHTVREGAFAGCEELDEVVLPKGLEVLEDEAFMACGLEEIHLPSSVRVLGDAVFADCGSLERVSGGDGLLVAGCDNFNGTPYLDRQRGLFGLGAVVMGFAGTCPAALAIPEGTVSLADCALYAQETLARVMLPSSLLHVGYCAFSGCSSLAQVSGGANVTTLGRYAFEDCRSLKAFEIPAGVKKLEYAFQGCSALARVSGGAGLVHVCEGDGYDFADTPFGSRDGAVVVGGVLIRYNGACPAAYAVPSGVKTIAADAFYRQTALRKVVLPDSLESIGNWAFEDCLSLAEVVGGASVEKVGYGAFYDTPYMENGAGYRVLGRCLWGYGWDDDDYPSTFAIPSGVVNVSLAGDDVESDVLRIPASVKRLDMGWCEPHAVEGGAGLQYVSGIDTERLKASRDGFIRVGSVIVGSELDDEDGGTLAIPEGVVAVGSRAFEYCGFTRLKLPSTLKTVNAGAFAYSDLQVVELGAGVETVCGRGLCEYEDEYENESEGAFAYCRDLRRVTVANPDVRIACGAFAGCESLASVTAPAEKDGVPFGGWQLDTGLDFGPGIHPFLCDGYAYEDTCYFSEFVSARWGQREGFAPVLFEDPTAGEFAGGDAFTGWVRDAAGQIVGTVAIKAGKPNKNGVSKITMTILRLGEKKKTLKGESSTGAGVKVELSGKGETATVQFGADGFVGQYGEFTLEGGRNVFASRDPNAKEKADMFARWLGVYTVAMLPDSTGAARADGWCALSVAVAKGGKAKVTGTMCDGTKVSASAQMIAGDNGTACVPVLAQLYSGKSGGFAFLLWVGDGGIRVTDAHEWDATSAKVPFKATWAEIRAGTPDRNPEKMVFAVDPGLTRLVDGAVLTNLLPVAESLVVEGARWKTAAKPSRVDRFGVAAGPNAGSLKVSYTAKSGLFKGSFKAFYNAGDKVKSETAKFTGVVVDGRGYGSAVFKKSGSCLIEVR